MSEATNTTDDARQGHESGHHLVTITVNKKPVPIEGPRVSGLQIKQAAIDAGLPIELDFQLAEIRGGEQHVIGDGDVVTVNKHSTFVCTAGDDNSETNANEP